MNSQAMDYSSCLAVNSKREELGREAAFSPNPQNVFCWQVRKPDLSTQEANAKGHLRYPLYPLSPGEPEDSWSAALRSLHLQQVECHYLPPSPVACEVQSVLLTQETPNKGEE